MISLEDHRLSMNEPLEAERPFPKQLWRDGRKVGSAFNRRHAIMVCKKCLTSLRVVSTNSSAHSDRDDHNLRSTEISGNAALREAPATKRPNPCFMTSFLLCLVRKASSKLNLLTKVPKTPKFSVRVNLQSISQKMVWLSPSVNLI